MSTILQLAETTYGEYRAPVFQSRRFTPAALHALLHVLAVGSSGLLTIEKAGTSFEGRPISLVRMGSGKTRILLWSQMHGDESTATMAIVDMLSFGLRHRARPEVESLLRSVSLYFVPMLNPDGAERFQRRTAQGIDMNRDALALVTPEARLLKGLQAKLKPEFGFNLHDQELSTVAPTKELTAVALLAPAFDAAKSDNDVRMRAKRLASLFAAMLRDRIPERVARYDDSFEPRAFGDNMQLWGTSTVLVESGHAMNDPEKDSIRKLNALGILHCCEAVAAGTYGSTDPSAYEQLPFNGKRAYDIIIRNIRVDHGEGKTTTADLGVTYQVDTHSEPTARLADLGDLTPFLGLKEIDGRGALVPAAACSLGNAFAWESYVKQG